MDKVARSSRRNLPVLLALALAAAAPARALAHCDTLDGPVVASAREALDRGEVASVLKWIPGAEEGEVRAAFARALAVRPLGAQARDLADRYFFETVVRIHRAGEGEPYTGLKPAGEPVAPGIAAADRALETGAVDGLVEALSTEIAAGIRARFAAVAARRRTADATVEGGRAWVAAYVEFVHHVERLHDAAATHAHQHGH